MYVARYIIHTVLKYLLVAMCNFILIQAVLCLSLECPPGQMVVVPPGQCCGVCGNILIYMYRLLMRFYVHVKYGDQFYHPA